jgi:ArsR family transcriptional regulator, arsenate/arsenite/antimonite-responsive transcriptional repressor
MTFEASVPESCGLLAAVAEPVRLSILRRLAADGRCCVCDLQSETPIASNLLSYHLRVLREAGLVTAIKRGRWVDYEMTPDALDRLHAALPDRRTGG